MLKVFEQECSPEEMLQQLKESEDCSGFLDYLNNWELRCVEVAGQLVKKWVRY